MVIRIFYDFLNCSVCICVILLCCNGFALLAALIILVRCCDWCSLSLGSLTSLLYCCGRLPSMTSYGLLSACLCCASISTLYDQLSHLVLTFSISTVQANYLLPPLN